MQLMTASDLDSTQAQLLASLPYLQSRTKNRLGGRMRTRMRRWLLETMGPVCVLCGNATDPDASPRSPDFPHMGHLISAEYIARMTGTDISDQGRKGGYVWGNLGIQHKGCNLDAGTSTIAVASLARPDLVPTYGPSHFDKDGTPIFN